MSDYDVLVVGAGYAGSIMAERLAVAARPARARDRPPRRTSPATRTTTCDEHGVLVHRYGPHIFHTKSREGRGLPVAVHRVAPYEHRVLARGRTGSCVPMPINRTTINELYGLDLRDRRGGGGVLRASARADRARPRRARTSVVAKVGRDLYEKFFRGYTRKQWERDPSRAARVGLRAHPGPHQHGRPLLHATGFQAMPADGYTAMFERILDHPRHRRPRSSTELRRTSATRSSYGHLVYTGPIDGFFGYRFGALPYREPRVRAAQRAHAGRRPRPAGAARSTIPSEDVPYTRMTEFRHLTGPGAAPELDARRRVPARRGRPVLPDPARRHPGAVPALRGARPSELDDVTFVGRLARYQYLNMDQVVGQALSAFAKLSARALV